MAERKENGATGYRLKVAVDEDWVRAARGPAKPADGALTTMPPEAKVVELPPALLPVEEAAKYLGVGRTEVFRLLREGKLRSVKIGRRRLIPRAELDRFVAELGKKDKQR